MAASQEIRATLNRHEILADTPDPSGGVVTLLNVTDGPKAGLHVLAGKSFRGASPAHGGSSTTDGVKDQYYYQTATREFYEESFAKLVDMKGDGILDAKLAEWLFTNEEITPLKEAIDKLAATKLYAVLNEATSEEALSATTPVEHARPTYLRKTYLAGPVKTTQADLTNYLTAATEIASIIQPKFMKMMNKIDADIAAAGEEALGFQDKKAILDATGLPDFTESSAIITIEAKQMAAAIQISKQDISESERLENTDPVASKEAWDRKREITVVNADGSETQEKFFRTGLMAGVGKFENSINALNEKIQRENSRLAPTASRG